MITLQRPAESLGAPTWLKIKISFLGIKQTWLENLRKMDLRNHCEGLQLDEDTSPEDEW